MRPIVLDKCIKFCDPSLNETKFHPKPSEAVFATVRCDFQPEVDIDVISNVAADYVGMDVCVKFCDSRSIGSQDI